MTDFYKSAASQLDPSELISAYFDDCISERDFAQLKQWIMQDADHARGFARAAMLHNYLRIDLQHADLRDFLMAHDSGSDVGLLVDPKNIRLMLDEAAEADARAARAAARRAAAEAEAAERRRLEAERLRRNRRPDPTIVPRSAVYFATAAMIAMLMLTIRTFLAPDDESPARSIAEVVPAPAEVAPTPPIATITDSLQARWANTMLGASPGTRLVAGRMTLETGVLEITFDGGARIVAEAPLEFNAVSASRVEVVRGKVVANVPEEAIGFTIVADAAAIVDLGTEFGVGVSDEGEVSVHVLDGEVALSPRGADEPGPRETLTEGAARSVSANGESVAVVDFDRSAFLRNVPASPYELAIRKSRPVAYWRLNEAVGSAQVKCFGKVESNASLGGGVTLGDAGNRPEVGNRVASFSDAHGGIDAGYDDYLALTSGFTLEAWVRTPMSHNLDVPQRILSTFEGEPNAGFAFGVAGPQFVGSKNLPSMMLLFTFYGVYDCVSQVGLNANQWTHVAAVVDEEGRPALFVDGKQVAALYHSSLRGFSAYRPLPVNWDPAHRGAASSSPLYLGRNPDVPNSTFPPEYWQGAIDEVAIFDRTLSSEEITKHYEVGLIDTDSRR